MNIDKLKTCTCVIIGVSGGPDSMALLDMCRREKVSMIVAHMNYKKRESADRDEHIVRQYCEKYGIQYEIMKQNKKGKGNFQAFAREERYLFYERLLQQYHADCVVLAHHMDDHLETYFMQKQRKSLVTYYGIRNDTIVYRCRIIRPLLHMTKKDIEAYCALHSVPYGIDESNLTDDYTRNQIRHTLIDTMTLEEKKRVCEQIKSENEQRSRELKESEAFLRCWDYSISSLIRLKETIVKQCISTWVYERCQIRLSQKEIMQIYYLLLYSQNWTRDIKEKYILYAEYGKLWIDEKEVVQYVYELDEVMCVQTPYFSVLQKGTSTQAATVTMDDFPITIRSPQEGDMIHLRFGRKKLNRWFIDRKIPRWERKRWPVVVNAKGDIILIPEIGCDIKHFSNNPNIFVVK